MNAPGQTKSEDIFKVENPDMPVDRREHRVIPKLVHTATAACELESKVLLRKKNVIGSKIGSKTERIYQPYIQDWELPFLLDLLSR